VTIPEDEGYSAYLFAYFTGNDGTEEAIRFALSSDGYVYKALNNNLPVVASDTISDKGGVRDPHILRGADGNTFYMVVTDMKSANGWNSNHGMVLLKSSDLVNWTHSRIDMHTAFPKFSTVNRVWAPQTIYDTEKGKYMIYWSMRSGNDPDVIYYSYANDNFTTLETEPQVLFIPENKGSCIDGDIIYNGGLYHLFFKTEGSGNGIKKAVSSKLTEGYVLQDRYLQQTTQAVEGSCVFRLINSDTHILMYDMYTSGRYQLTESTDLHNFSVTSRDVSMNFSPRHGTVIPVTSEEVKALMDKWSGSSGISKIEYNTDNLHPVVIWPNPVKNGLNFEFEGRTNDPVFLEIFGIAGKKFISGKLIAGADIVDCSGLPQGYYLLHLRQGARNLAAKFVKVN
jgi:hypothetical protein